MSKTPSMCLVIAVIIVLSVGAAASGLRTEYKAKDGSRVVVVTATKSREAAGPESTVDFYSPQNQTLCSVDFSSDDGEHGFGVVKAAWSPDGKYFVFSTISSGGHQPWHWPTVFYSLRDKEIRNLDRYSSAAGISRGDFKLKSPNIVLTEVWKGKSVPAEFQLDSLGRDKPEQEPALVCKDGKVFRADPYELRNDGTS
jgi:hypothetical protein